MIPCDFEQECWSDEIENEESFSLKAPKRPIDQDDTEEELSLWSSL